MLIEYRSGLISLLSIDARRAFTGPYSDLPTPYLIGRCADTMMDAVNVRRDFRRALRLVPGLDPEAWTPCELRHSIVPNPPGSRFG